MTDRRALPLGPAGSTGMHPQAAGQQHRKFLTDLSSSLFSFVLPLLPTSEERAVKEEVRGLIEKLVKTIEPSARLLSFGSSQNSFGLRNSDMDLVVLIDDSTANLEASHLVQMIGDLLLRETNFDVKPLPKARIPILKLTLAPSAALPYGIACDIGIENRLAIENTRLLLTYATIDPARVRTLVLFLKVWAKRRRINSPYRGTLSSYGFTLMVLYFLVHVKQPPVLPNLQRIAPLRPLAEHEVMLQGRNVYFFDDTETLRQEWSSINYETVGELLIDFFRYYSHDFQFNNSVMSLRAGQLTKESKGWVNDIDVGGLNEMARDRNRLCIEDPFEVTYNVARTVTKDGLYTLRGEFMRATRILTQRPDRAVTALAELCRDREEEVQRAPRSSSPAPRAISQSRSAFNTPNTNGGGAPWRSQSQTPFERQPGATFETPSSGPRRARHSEGGADAPQMQDYTAQEQWLASQGANLGNVNPGGLGLGLDEYLVDYPAGPGDSSGGAAHGDRGGRGRESTARGLETPGGFGSRTPGRSATYDPSAGAGSGSISAPLSPHRLYAQLEMNRPQVPPVWPSTAFDKLHPSGTVPPPGAPSYIPVPGRSASHGSSGMPFGHGEAIYEGEPPSPLPAFTPFSPPAVPSLLKPLNGEPANYISPSTLLSPPNPGRSLSSTSPTSPPGAGSRGEQAVQKDVNGLADKFGALGVAPPGSGAENPAGARKEEASSAKKDGKEGEGGIAASGPASRGLPKGRQTSL